MPWNELVIYGLHIGTFNDQDGIFDCAQFIRTVNGTDHALPEGWSLLQRINSEVSSRFPGRISAIIQAPTSMWNLERKTASPATPGCPLAPIAC